MPPGALTKSNRLGLNRKARAKKGTAIRKVSLRSREAAGEAMAMPVNGRSNLTCADCQMALVCSASGTGACSSRRSAETGMAQVLVNFHFREPQPQVGVKLAGFLEVMADQIEDDDASAGLEDAAGRVHGLLRVRGVVK